MTLPLSPQGTAPGHLEILECLGHHGKIRDWSVRVVEPTRLIEVPASYGSGLSWACAHCWRGSQFWLWIQASYCCQRVRLSPGARLGASSL